MPAANRNILDNAANVVLRTISLGARFLLILILARALGPSEFGLFTLVQTTEIISILFLGFEFNAFSRREIVVAPDAITQARHIRDQFAIACILGANALLISFAATFVNLIPHRLTLIVAALIFVDLISQEGIRILYALQRITTANWAYFIRSSVWVLIIGVLFLYSPHALTLDLTLKTWVAFSATATLFIFWSLRSYPWGTVLRLPIDWRWIARGFRVAAPFFVSTAFINILTYLPRYMLFYLRGLEQTGLFGFYTGIAVGIVNLISTITIPEGVAKAVFSFNRHGETAFKTEMLRLWRNAILLSLILAAGLMAVFPFILPLVGSKNYPMDWLLLTLVVLSNVAQVASMVAQTSLYARHRDKEILISTLGAGTLSLALQYVFTLMAGMHGLAFAMALSTCLLTALFLYFERKAAKDGTAIATTR